MKVVIVAGGLGTRMSEETATRPKPLVEIGGHPVLWHIMKTYAHYGHTEFVICLGYKAESVKDYFLNYPSLADDFTVDLRDGQVTVHTRRAENWRVTLVDTGATTQTGGRLARVRDYVDGGTFLFTYGDGLADIDIGRLVSFHKQQRRLATVTAVRPPGRYGILDVSQDRVLRFREKPAAGEGWINGGYFVLEPGVFSYLAGDGTVLEREPLEGLARDSQLAAFCHSGFWRGMDTLRDVRELGDLWDRAAAPWKVWE